MLAEILPKSIDTRRLDIGGARFEGTVSLAAMRRLRELVLTPEGKVCATVEVRFDEAMYVTVSGVATARVRLECQRCLGPKEVLLRAVFRLLAVDSVAEAEVLNERNDPLIAPGGVFDLLTALEDELLLALPSVAMHESEEVCGQCSFHFGTPQVPDATPHHQSPFAVLEQLKKRGD